LITHSCANHVIEESVDDGPADTTSTVTDFDGQVLETLNHGHPHRRQVFVHPDKFDDGSHRILNTDLTD